MRFGALGLSELLLVLIWPTIIIGIIWFVVWALLAIVKSQRKMSEALERIAESPLHRP